ACCALRAMRGRSPLSNSPPRRTRNEPCTEGPCGSGECPWRRALGQGGTRTAPRPCHPPSLRAGVPMPKIHASVTPERVLELVEAQVTSLDNPGICISCGADADGCDPDTVRARCEACGAMQVYGAEQLALMMVP